MSTRTKGGKRRWAWAAGCGVVATALVVALLSGPKRLPPGPSAPRAGQSIDLQKLDANSALNDAATLLDPTPLFLPTKHNSAQKDVAPLEPGGTFQSYRIPPKLNFAETGPEFRLPPPVDAPARPTDALAADAPGVLLLGLGRAEPPGVVLPARGAFVEIVAAGTGQQALPRQRLAQVQALAAAARPPAGRTWQPMEFLAAVDAAGLVGPLVLTARSGVEEVDAYFQNYLVRTLRVGERLAPGFYRIGIGP
ncbi:MAG: hypothetical protein EXS32_01600 [Opitutus sp.]|nr:hypothetical protein [Opitutus sp.]